MNQAKNKSRDFADMIETFAPKMVGTKGKLYVKPDMPMDKLKKATSTYADGVFDMNVVALYDGGMIGSSPAGFVITKAAFYYKEVASKPFVLPFKQIKNIRWTKLRKARKMRKSKDYIKITINTTEGYKELVAKDTYLDSYQFYLFLREVLKYVKNNEVDETDKAIILEDMPYEVKLHYVKAIAQFVFETFDEFDAHTLSEIQTLMAQLDFDVMLRHEVRAYLSTLDQSLENLIEPMFSHAPRGSEMALKFSLIKDMIRVYRARDASKAPKTIKTLNDLAEILQINEAQIDVLEAGILNDEKIFRGEVKDDQIIKNAKDLSAKAAAVGVPIAAVYMSGSVAGLSAAGITSGLAALGLGGVLGLSSMVTGIGVAVLGGVVVYKGIQWATGGSERSKTAKREFIIQEIIKNNQRTINNLAEDVNYYAEKLIEVTKEQEINRQRLNQLAEELKLFTEALRAVQDRGNHLVKISN